MELKIPNAETQAAMAEAHAIIAARRARLSDADDLIADVEENSCGQACVANSKASDATVFPNIRTPK